MLRLTLTGINVVYYGEYGSLVSPTDVEAAQSILGREGWYSERRATEFFAQNHSERHPIFVWQNQDGSNRVLLHFPSCTFIDAAGEPISKQKLRLLRADHPVLAATFADQERQLLLDYEAAAAYTERVFSGSWDQFIDRVYNDPVFALEHAKVVKADSRKALEIVIMRSPMVAARYARQVKGRRWPEAEPIIASDAEAAVYYASVVMKERWKEAEPTIATDPLSSMNYAQLVIDGRWQEAEATILTDGAATWDYLQNVVRQPWPDAEPIVLTDPLMCAQYARDYKRGPWLAAEPTILLSATATLIYCRDVLRKTWKAAEEVILSCPLSAASYAAEVMRARWKKAEQIISTCPEASYRYTLKVIRPQRIRQFETTIQTSPLWAYSYGVDVLGQRWFDAEPEIMKNESIWKLYTQHFGVPAL